MSGFEIQFLGARGDVTVVRVAAGTSVMRAAIENGVPGIVGECGGQAMCATCHVYVECDGLAAPMSDDEDAMLDIAAEPRDGRRSRLGCQLTAGLHFDDLLVELPARQV